MVGLYFPKNGWLMYLAKLAKYETCIKKKKCVRVLIVRTI